MATVFKGRRRGRGGFRRDVALKVIHPHLSSIDGFMARLLDEASVASRIHHPNVCAVIDIDAARGYHFLVLELIDGVTIRQIQNFSHVRMVMPAEEAARLIADAARGLAALHDLVDDDGRSLEVVHRDISPHNLMLDSSGRTVLIDLGLAAARDRMGHTQTGVLVGKLPYMSPEQTRLARLDPRSDIFSLGAVLFELMTGAPPFGDEHTPDTLARLRACEHATLEAALQASNAPGWICEVVLGCLHASPAERYQDAGALATDLERGIHATGIPEQTIRARLARRARDTQRAYAGGEKLERLPPAIQTRLPEGAPLRTALALVGIIALGVLGIFALTQDNPAPQQNPGAEDPRAADMIAAPPEPQNTQARDPSRRDLSRTRPLESDAPPLDTSTTAAEDGTGTGDGDGLEAEATAPAPEVRTRKSRSRTRRTRKKAKQPEAPQLQGNPYE